MSTKRIKIEYSVDVDVDRWVAYSGLSPEDIDSDVHDFAIVSLYLKFHEVGVLAKTNETLTCDQCGHPTHDDTSEVWAFGRVCYDCAPPDEV